MRNDIKAVSKVFLAVPGGHGKPFLGPGMIRLLEHIKKTGNVRKACEHMHISYSKGWKLLRTLESCLEAQVVFRRRGGQDGGNATLTEKGIALLETHNAFERDCALAVETLFEKHYALLKNWQPEKNYER